MLLFVVSWTGNLEQTLGLLVPHLAAALRPLWLENTLCLWMSFTVFAHGAIQGSSGAAGLNFASSRMSIWSWAKALFPAGERWGKRRGRPWGVWFDLLLLWGQQEGAGGAWLLPGKANLQLETTNPWWQWPAWLSKATDKISIDLGQQTVEETEWYSPAAFSLVCWTGGILFLGGNCTLVCLLKKISSALIYAPPGDQISQQDRRVFFPPDLTFEGKISRTEDEIPGMFF